MVYYGVQYKRSFEAFSLRELSAHTHPGKVRGHNEDTVVVVPEQGVCVLADGVGGHQRGEIASRVVCDSVRDSLLAGHELVDAIHTAHLQVLQAIASSTEGRERPGMGATVVAAKISPDSTYEVAWVGDSRIYLWDGTLQQISRDHSVVGELLARNAITPEQARVHPDRNVITQSLGVSPDMQLDVGYVTGVLEPDSQLLLCSDGLTDELSDEMISQVFVQFSDAEAQQEALLNMALDTPARDNISVIVVGPAAQSGGRLGNWLNTATFLLATAAFVFVASRLL